MPSADAEGLFVTGTDTGVGKTLVSAALVRLLRGYGRNAVGFKPVATGEVNGNWSDAIALHEASDGAVPLEKICPLRFTLPLAPTLSAKAQGLSPDLSLAHAMLTELRATFDSVIVEGVGGLLVPLDSKTLVLDFAAHIGFPVLVVCRAGLGTINHTLLTLRELDRAGLNCVGIVMNITRSQDETLAIGSKSEIERISGKKIIAIIPHLKIPTLHEKSPTTQDEFPLLYSQVTRAMESLSSQINVISLLAPERKKTSLL